MKTADNVDARKGRGRMPRRTLPLRQIAGNPFWPMTARQISISCNHVRPDRMILSYRIKSSNPED
jgi:hypothetical protein